MALGCDTATSVTSARLKSLTDKKITFVGRYLNRLEKMHDELTTTERDRLCDAGLYVYSFYQADGTTNTSHFTKNNGIADAKDAIKLAADVGQPAGTPIYFAVDFDASLSQIETYIVPYFQGVISILKDSDYKLGIYGSPRTCGYIRGSYGATERYTCVSDCGWGGDFDDWNLRQYDHGSTLGTGTAKIDIDYNESSAHGGGGWKV